MSQKVIVPLASGFEEIEAVSIIDTLRRAELDVDILSITEERLVAGSHEIAITADALYEEYQVSDSVGIILPGGLPGSTNLSQCQALIDDIQSFAKQGKLLAAVCAAPTVLASAGVLENKQATCYPGFESKLAGALFSEDNVVVSENIITSRGVGTCLNFALAIVAYFKGEEFANDLAVKMLVK